MKKPEMDIGYIGQKRGRSLLKEVSDSTSKMRSLWDSYRSRGENSTSELKTSQTAPIKTATIEEVVEPAVEAEVPEVPDHLGVGFEDEPRAEGRGKRIWKESTYTRRLRDGEGVMTGLPSTTLLPKGLPQVQEEKEVGDLADAVNEMFEWDVVDVEKEFAMATAIEGAKGLNPSFEEVRKRADWP